MDKSVLHVYGEMPIGAWVSPPPPLAEGKDHITPINYRTARACGLNFLHTLYEEDDAALNEKALSCAADAGMKLILNDTAFFAGSAEARLAAYRKWPSFWGVNLKDEPGLADFDRLAGCVKRYRPHLAEGELLYGNLMPMYASPQQLNGGWFEGRADASCSYENYISGFVKRVGLPVLSYDFYPFRGEKGHTDADYFTQLEIGLRHARAAGVPLWVFVQVASWLEGEIRAMTYSEILWQVSVALAFGVKGLQYFTYWTPIDRGGERFSAGMIAPDGGRTERYYFVQDVNRQARAAGARLLRAEPLGVFTNSGAPVPAVCRVERAGIEVEGGNYLVGCFSLEGRRLYYLVNLSLFETRAYGVRLDKPMLLVRAGSEVEAGKRSSAVLGPGEGILIEESER